MLASLNGHVGCVYELLNAKASCNRSRQGKAGGESALMLAALQGHVAVCG